MPVVYVSSDKLATKVGDGDIFSSEHVARTKDNILTRGRPTISKIGNATWRQPCGISICPSRPIGAKLQSGIT